MGVKSRGGGEGWSKEQGEEGKMGVKSRGRSGRWE